MIRQRLPPAPPVDYQVIRTNDKWGDHILRSRVTSELVAWLNLDAVADPACGDASILYLANKLRPLGHVELADVSVPMMDHLATVVPQTWHLQAAPIDVWLAQPHRMLDIVLLTEILEHLEDPDAVLQQVRQFSKYLIASSPAMRPGQVDANPEHLWMFDLAGMESLLNDNGWEIQQTTILAFRSDYDFQIHIAK